MRRGVRVSGRVSDHRHRRDSVPHPGRRAPAAGLHLHRDGQRHHAPGCERRRRTVESRHALLLAGLQHDAHRELPQRSRPRATDDRRTGHHRRGALRAGGRRDHARKGGRHGHHDRPRRLHLHHARSRHRILRRGRRARQQGPPDHRGLRLGTLPDAHPGRQRHRSDGVHDHGQRHDRRGAERDGDARRQADDLRGHGRRSRLLRRIRLRRGVPDRRPAAVDRDGRRRADVAGGDALGVRAVPAGRPNLYLLRRVHPRHALSGLH